MLKSKDESIVGVEISNLMKRKRGITLVALVITIIVLLILAGVSIAMLAGENGILAKTQEAIRKSENAQIQENATLADYENGINVNGYPEESVDGSRDEVQTATVSMRSPVFLTSATLADTKTSARPAATYKASSTSYTKSPSSNMAKYLSLQANGWKAIKEGWYLIGANCSHTYSSGATGALSAYVSVNGSYINPPIIYRWIANAATGTNDSGNMNIYLKENDLLDYAFVPSVSGTYSYTNVWIYALFE